MNRVGGSKVVFLGCLMFVTFANAWSQTVAYRVVPLGPVIEGVNSPSPHDINNKGWVVGTNRGAAGNVGYLWKGGVVTPMPTLGGTCSSASGINEQGDVAGTACVAGDATRHGVIWRGGTRLVDLGLFAGIFSTANRINGKGQVMGIYDLPDGSFHMYFLKGKVWEDVGANLFPGGLNDAGEISGQFDVGPPDPVSGVAPSHGFYWYKGKLRDFGALFGTNYNYAIDIDAAGRVAATTDLAGDLVAHGIIWDHGFISDLAPLPTHQVSWAMGMNNKVQIVGLSGLRDTEPTDGPPVQTMMCPCTPVLWSDGTVVDLNALIPPEWVLIFAFDINDQGQIIARARQNFGPAQSVKLVPIKSATSEFAAQGISGQAKHEQMGGPRRLVREKSGEIRQLY